MKPLYDVFLSHSSADKPAVEKLALKLQEAGIEPFLDKWHLIPGDPWQEALEEALDASRTCAVFLGPKGLGGWQNEEMRSALETRVGNRAFRVIPVLLPGSFEPRKEALPRFLRRLTWVDFRGGLDDEDTFQRLISGIRGQAPGPGGSGGGGPAKSALQYRCMAQPPEGWIHRREYDEVLEALCSKEGPQAGRSVGITTALRGAGGFGKTALAQKLCFDERVREAYPDGILWTTMGEDLTEIGRLSRIRDLIRGWTGSELHGFPDLQAASSNLREMLNGKRVLIVVDDVWSRADILPFQGLGEGSALLVTTRVTQALPDDSLSIPVDAMASSEAVSLLELGLPNSPRRDIESLAARLGEWALLLKLVNGTLKKLVKGGLTVPEALQRVNEDLEAEGFKPFDQLDPDDRHAAASKTILVSVKRLPSEKDRGLFLDLAIFPEDEDIPRSVLDRYWGLNRTETRTLCEYLHELSLLRALDLKQELIRLHDVTRQVLIDQRREDLPALHRRLLDLSRPASGEWKDLPGSETYLWRRLAYHLLGAARKDEIRALLLNFPFLSTKLKATDINSLIGEYEPFVSEDQGLRLVQSALRLSAHVLAKDRDQLAFQLLGRLLSRNEPGLHALLEEAKNWRESVWLRPRTGSLVQPGDALIRTLEGHTDGVNAVAVVDNRRVLSASEDRTLLLWELETGKILRTFEGHMAPVRAVAKVNSRRAISGDTDGILRLWDLETGRPLQTLEGNASYVLAVAVVDDRHAVSASIDGTLRFWDLETGKTLQILRGHTDRANMVVVFDGRRALSASRDRTLRVWDLETGRNLQTLKGHTAEVTTVALLDDRQAISASHDSTLRIWDLETGEVIRTLEGHTDVVFAVTILDNRHAISASFDRTLRIWDLDTGKSLRTLEGHMDYVTAVAVVDNRRALSASFDKTLRLWDLEAGRTIKTFKGHSELIYSMAILDGSRAISASGDQTLRVWDLETGGTGPAQEEDSGWVHVVAMSKSRVISATLDGTLRVWDLKTGENLWLLAGAVVSALAILEDRRAVFASPNGTLGVFDLKTGKIFRTLQGHTGRVSGVVVLDGRRVVSASSDRTLRVWDMKTGKTLKILEGHTLDVRAVAAIDSRRVVSASSDHTLRVWDLEKEKTLHVLEGHTQWVNAVAVDGQRAVSASFDRTLLVWDLENGKVLHNLKGHTHHVNAVAVLAGHRAVSASTDQTLRVWDLETGELLAVITLDTSVQVVAASSNGKVVVAGDRSGRVHFFDLVELE